MVIVGICVSACVLVLVVSVATGGVDWECVGVSVCTSVGVCVSVVESTSLMVCVVVSSAAVVDVLVV